MKIFLVLTASLLLAACQQVKEVQNSGTTISGTIEGAEGRTVFFKRFDGTGEKDTILIGDDGTFSVNIGNRPLDFYMLYFHKRAQLALILDSTQTNIKVTANVDDVANTAVIEGSKDSELMAAFFRKQMAFNTRADSLKKLVQSMDSSMGDIRQALSRQMAKEQMDFEKEMVDLANENSTSPSALSVIPMITASNHIATLEKVYNDLSVRLPGNQYVEGLKTQIDQAKQQKSQTAPAGQVAIGAIAPDLELEDPDGKVIPLSSLRGKYVLLDFWASWCGPCRRENPNVKRMYDKYKKENFEIYGISFDNNKDRWLQAIEKDDLPWVHVSDLKKWQSIAAGLYGVRSIPHTVLLDPDGKVVATKLRGPSLDNKMAEIFGY